MTASQMNTSEENKYKDGLSRLHYTYKRSIHICVICGESRQTRMFLSSFNVAGDVFKRKTDGGRGGLVLL